MRRRRLLPEEFVGAGLPIQRLRLPVETVGRVETQRKFHRRHFASVTSTREPEVTGKSEGFKAYTEEGRVERCFTL